MGYTALYREWRPQRFSEVVGQRHVTQTLQNALLKEHLSHAYLFSGPRGTGKTSVAKLLAKAVNCAQAPTPEPCNSCPSCTAIQAGYSMDVIEIDGASNRGIDEIRDLRERVRYAATGSRFKVYIVDEVHMLTPEAFNALLKTLEEPPPHVIFIFATTEPQKVPATILSRCQRFDFHRLSAVEIAGRLRDVVAANKMVVPEEVLLTIARFSDGALRDALSMLDQALAYKPDGIKVDDVLEILGRHNDQTLSLLIEALADGNIKQVLFETEKVLQAGQDMRQLARDLTEYYRDLLLVKVANDSEALVNRTTESLQRLRQLAGLFSEAELLESIRLLARGEADMKWASQPKIILDITLLELARSRKKVFTELTLPTTGLEGTQQIDAGKVNNNQVSAPAEGVPLQPQSHLPTAAGNEGQARQVSLEDIKEKWRTVLEQVKKEKKSTHAYLLEGKPVALEGDRLILSFRYAFHQQNVEKPEHRALLERVMKNLFGVKFQIKAVIEAPDSATSALPANQELKRDVAVPDKPAGEDPGPRNNAPGDNRSGGHLVPGSNGNSPGESSSRLITKILNMFGGEVFELDELDK